MGRPHLEHRRSWAFQTFSFVSFCFFMISMDLFMSFGIMRGWNLQLRLKMKPHHWLVLYFLCLFVQFHFYYEVFSFQSSCVTKLALIVVYRIVKTLDIRCVSSNEYIESFSWNWISIVFCCLNGYIRSFDFNWIFVVFRNRVEFIESFNKIL